MWRNVISYLAYAYVTAQVFFPQRENVRISKDSKIRHKLHLHESRIPDLLIYFGDTIGSW